MLEKSKTYVYLKKNTKIGNRNDILKPPIDVLGMLLRQIAFSLILALTFAVDASSLRFRFQPVPVGAFQVPEDPSEVFFGVEFIEPAKWQANPLSSLGTLYEHLAQTSFITRPNEEYLVISKAVNLVNVPVEQIVSRKAYSNPAYHIALNPSFNLKLMNETPLAFHSTQSIYGYELKAELYVKFIDQEDYVKNPALEALLPVQQKGQLPYAAAIRYSGTFNKTVDKIITVSEFFKRDARTSILVTYLVMGVKKNIGTHGVFSGPFKSKLESHIKDIAEESLTNLNQLIGQ